MFLIFKFVKKDQHLLLYPVKNRFDILMMDCEVNNEIRRKKRKYIDEHYQ